MKIYLVSDINKRYSDIIADYISNGFVINCGTMSGTQGEIAKTHLVSPDRTYLLNVIMDKTTDWRSSSDILNITISKYMKEELSKDAFNNISSWATVWNEKGEEVFKESYYMMSFCDCKAFTDKESYEEIKRIRRERYDNHSNRNVKNFGSSAYELVLPFIKRQPKCKTMKLSDITDVYKLITSSGKSSYYIKAKGRTFCLQ